MTPDTPLCEGHITSDTEIVRFPIDNDDISTPLTVIGIDIN